MLRIPTIEGKTCRTEKGLKLNSFECDSCSMEVELDELWSVEMEGKVYRIHVCQECLRKML